MALYVVLKSKNPETGNPNTLELHVPFKNLLKLENEEIDFIQADGDELEAITDNFFCLLSPSNKRVVRWYGDIAKTIYFNL